ncbi:MAG: hypothetical protein LUF26_03735 [Firmicutes bacterium]|nr:hypothetical protein [Bacillota bacterium]
MQKIFCPECGHETQVNGDREFAFCPECGNKIMIPKSKPAPPAEPSNDTDAAPSRDTAAEPSIDTAEAPGNVKAEDENYNPVVTSKLEEVDFYYKLSFEKKEFENTSEEPVYYLKAQDILVDLSELYPDDYRIWWELCKPIDYMCSDTGADIHNQYSINENYFGKALDKAELSKKRMLVEQHDRYIKNKEAAKELAAKRLEEEEKARTAKELAEKKRAEEEEKAHAAMLLAEKKPQEETLERETPQHEKDDRKTAEAEIKRAEEETKREEQKRIEEEKALAAEREDALESSKPLWTSLLGKDYSKIDNTYFEMPQANNQTIIGVFKLVSNMLYLSSYRIDGNKGNTVYQEQGFAMQFNADGYGVKFNNRPVMIKGYIPPDNTLRVFEMRSGALYVNKIMLKSDSEYIASIMRSAKKSHFSNAKIFS